MGAEDRLRARSGGSASDGRNTVDHLGHFPFVLLANLEWKNGIIWKTHLNTVDILELEQAGRVQEAKVDAVGIPSFIDNIIGQAVKRILGFGPAVALHL